MKLDTLGSKKDSPIQQFAIYVQYALTGRQKERMNAHHKHRGKTSHPLKITP